MAALSKVSEVTIEVTGYGASLNSSISDGLLVAVKKVNGVKVASQSKQLLINANMNDGTQSASQSLELTAKAISESTNGAVLNYEILSEKKVDNQYILELSVTIPKYELAEHNKRDKIAVLGAKTLFSKSSINKNYISSDKTVSAVGRELNLYLTNTNKFAVLDRANVNAVTKELDVAASSQTHITQVAKLGNKLAADYVLATTIPTFEYKIKTKKSRLDNRSIEYAEGEAVAIYKLIEVATGQTVFSDKVTVSVNHNHRQLLESEVAFNLLVDELSRSLARDIQNNLYPIALLEKKGKSVELNSVALFEEGELYNIYHVDGSKANESFCCVVEISKKASAVSKAKIVDGLSYFDEHTFRPYQYVVREQIAKTTKSSEIDISEKVKLIKQQINATDDDW